MEKATKRRGKGEGGNQTKSSKKQGVLLKCGGNPLPFPSPLLHLPDLHKYASQIAHNVSTNSQMMIMRVDK